MHFLSRVSSKVDLDRMLRLVYDVQLQLLTDALPSHGGETPSEGSHKVKLRN